MLDIDVVTYTDNISALAQAIQENLPDTKYFIDEDGGVSLRATKLRTWSKDNESFSLIRCRPEDITITEEHVGWLTKIGIQFFGVGRCNLIKWENLEHVNYCPWSRCTPEQWDIIMRIWDPQPDEDGKIPRNPGNFM